MEFLHEASLGHEGEIYGDFSQGSSIDVEQMAAYNEGVLTFDWHSFKRAQEIITGSTEEADDEFIESDNEMEIFEEEFERTVPSLGNHAIKLTHCVIIDNDNDQHTIQRCNNAGVRSVGQLSGTWEVDSKAVQEVGNEISKLGICLRHLNYDQNTAHKPESGRRIKAERTTEESIITSRRCLFCKKLKCFFTRGKTCSIHAWKVYERVIQAPCRGLFDCPAITSYDGLSTKSFTDDHPRFICTNCFVIHGGHLHIQPGKGKRSVSCLERGQHDTDTTFALKLFGRWIEQTATSNNKTVKVNLLKELVKILGNLTMNIPEVQNTVDASSTVSTIPSLFLIKTAFAIKKIDVNEEAQATQLKTTTCKDFGRILAHSVLQARSELKQKLPSLEEPESLDEYYNAMPSPLVNFFVGLVSVLEEKRNQILDRKRKERNLPPSQLDGKKTKALPLFFASVLLTVAFRHWKIWFTHVLSSLCRRPKMIGFLHKILHAVQVVSYVRDHEVRVQRKRMIAAEPRSRLNLHPNVWNLAVIDNIDMKDNTFQYGNIFDATRGTAHATLRMVFQFQCSELANVNGELLENPNLFGKSSIMDKWQEIVNTAFSQLISQEQTFGIEHLDAIIKKHIDSALFVAPPNVVILEPGEAPSKDEYVHQAVDMFLEDFGYMENSVLHLVCDEAIYHRMKDYKNEEQMVYCILGQWHTNKAMCSALIAAFSGYGLFGLAAQLGVRFLDRLEQVADYRATFRVLELIWTAVGVAIHLYIQEENISINDIPTKNNNLLKVWYNFYQWAGYLKLHKLGIRMANFDLQMHSLMAFAPLFPITGKRRYAASVARFLSDLQSKPGFLQALRAVPSINLTREEHYFAFDEALETFGVKFIKENMTGQTTNLENLKQNIKAAQGEYDRLNLLISEFAGDRSVSRSSRSAKDRQETLWKLITELRVGFSSSQPESHILFAEATQLTDAGFQRMFTCYKSGIERMTTIVEQDINHTAPQVKAGRGRRDLTPMKPTKKKKRERTEADRITEIRVEEAGSSSVQAPELIDMEVEETNKEDLQSIPLPEIGLSSGSTFQTSRPTKHKSTDVEEQFLKQLEAYKNSTILPREVVNDLVEKLSQHTDYWTPKRVRDRWYNRYKRTKKNDN